MPRYHVIIRGSSLGAVEKEMPIAVKRQGKDVVVDLRAADAKTAKDSVSARLPPGSHVTVEDPQEVPD